MGWKYRLSDSRSIHACQQCSTGVETKTGSVRQSTAHSADAGLKEFGNSLEVGEDGCYLDLSRFLAHVIPV